jgi:hypothetical protein
MFRNRLEIQPDWTLNQPDGQAVKGILSKGAVGPGDGFFRWDKVNFNHTD